MQVQVGRKFKDLPDGSIFYVEGKKLVKVPIRTNGTNCFDLEFGAAWKFSDETDTFIDMAAKPEYVTGPDVATLVAALDSVRAELKAVLGAEFSDSISARDGLVMLLRRCIPAKRVPDETIFRCVHCYDAIELNGSTWRCRACPNAGDLYESAPRCRDIALPEVVASIAAQLAPVSYGGAALSLIELGGKDGDREHAIRQHADALTLAAKYLLESCGMTVQPEPVRPRVIERHNAVSNESRKFRSPRDELG